MDKYGSVPNLSKWNLWQKTSNTQILYHQIIPFSPSSSTKSFLLHLTKPNPRTQPSIYYIEPNFPCLLIRTQPSFFSINIGNLCVTVSDIGKDDGFIVYCYFEGGHTIMRIRFEERQQEGLELDKILFFFPANFPFSK